jgi:hypothetical protein
VKRIALIAAAAAAVPAAATAVATAGPTSTWSIETYGQFDAGDATDAYLTSLGEVRPGWQTTRVALEGDGVWAALRTGPGCSSSAPTPRARWSRSRVARPPS